MKHIITKSYLAIAMIMGVLSSYAQDLPKFVDLSEDKTQLITGDQEISGFYNESKLRQIYLEFDDIDYWTQLEDKYNTDIYVEISCH